MGVKWFQTHGRRSSDMSCGISLERKQPEPVRWSLVVVILFAFMMMLLFYGTSLKKIELVVDGETTVIKTRAETAGDLLAEQGIEVGPHDRLAAPEGELATGDRIEVVHTQPILLEEGGERTLVHTAGTTVGEALEDLGIVLGHWDRTVPALHERLEAGSMLKVVRVTREYEEMERDIPFATVTREDKTLTKGKQKVLQEGRPGVLVELVENVFEDGRLVTSRVIDSSLKSPGKDQVVAIGTRSPVMILSADSPAVDTITKGGITFDVKQVLTDVTLTIYDAGPQSTGKDVGHPLYGITFTGTTVEEGRTIAVDPKVIPLGWWVYIEGIGFRKAEDTGSAIKGRKIDVYYDDADEAPFGRKRGVTVYIIGPDKPAGL